MNGTESRFSAGVSNAWSERMRLIRFRRKKERTSLREEFKIVPKWLVTTLVVLFLIAEAIGLMINLSGVLKSGHIFPERVGIVAACFAMAGIIAGASIAVAVPVLLAGYVYRDAKRRGMNAMLWTLLCVILFPAYLALGFIIYFLVREPLPYACPKCGTTVGARFNFCPSCKNDLHPSCPQCRREIVETDRFCPYCAHELTPTTSVDASPKSES